MNRATNAEIENVQTTSTHMDEVMAAAPWGIEALRQAREARRKHQSRYAAQRQNWIDKNRYYYNSIRRAFRFIVEPASRVLNVRCETGYLLETVEASYGVGVEISESLVAVARQRYPQFKFVCSDPEDLSVADTFDYVIFNDIADTIDVLGALKKIAMTCESHTRLLIYGYSRIWQPILEVASWMGLRMKRLEPNWLSEQDIKGLLRLSDFDHVHTYRVILIPYWIPILSEFCNRFLARLPLLSKLCLVSVIVARPQSRPIASESVDVSIIIPCRNERGNIEVAVQRMPEMGRHTEIIFCDDKSTDGTAAEVRRVQHLYPHKDIRLLEGPGISKAENVWTGFRAARGDILIILDGDLAVMPEELPYFVEALIEKRGEFINGSRLVYPVPKTAMKHANLIGNKAFSLLFSYLIDQRIKDTLCGTKVLWRRDWQRLEKTLGSWGVHDRWGDYELLFGAAKLQLAIIDMPIHYQERVYGVTKMTKVLWNGLNMLRMCAAAGLKLKGGF